MNRLTSQIFYILILLILLTAGSAFARMSGSGGATQGSMGTGDSEMSSGPSETGITDRSRGRPDIGSMPAITTGGLGSGDMTMEVTPLKYRDGRLEVKYYANTHSVSLGNYDLMELCTLEVNGKMYKPVRADRMRGHHAGGRIVFEVPEQPERFRIVIRDIPQVRERLYEWN